MGKGWGEKFPVGQIFSGSMWATGNDFLKGKRRKSDGMIRGGERMKERNGENTQSKQGGKGIETHKER